MTNKETSEALLPCPFCGGEAAYGQAEYNWFVNCTDCLASTNQLIPHSNSKQKATELWNTRPTTHPLAALELPSLEECGRRYREHLVKQDDWPHLTIDEQFHFKRVCSAVLAAAKVKWRE